MLNVFDVDGVYVFGVMIDLKLVLNNVVFYCVCLCCVCCFLFVCVLCDCIEVFMRCVIDCVCCEVCL